MAYNPFPSVKFKTQTTSDITKSPMYRTDLPKVYSTPFEKFREETFSKPLPITKPVVPTYQPPTTTYQPPTPSTPLPGSYRPFQSRYGAISTEQKAQLEGGTVARTVSILPKPILNLISGKNLVDNKISKAASSILNLLPGLGNIKNVLNTTSTIFPEKFGKENERQKKRFLDNITLGASGEADKLLGNDVSYLKGRSFKKDPIGASLDTASTFAGLAAPGLGSLKVAKYAGLGATEIPKLAKGATKLQKSQRIGKIALQQAKEGAATGAILSTGQVLTREIFNPDEYTLEDNAKKIAFDTISGALIDPVLYGLATVVAKKFVKEELPKIGEIKSPENAKQEILALPAGEKILALPEASKVTPEMVEEIFFIKPNKQQMDFLIQKVIENYPENYKKFISKYGFEIEKVLTPEEMRIVRQQQLFETFSDEISKLYKEDEIINLWEKLLNSKKGQKFLSQTDEKLAELKKIQAELAKSKQSSDLTLATGKQFGKITPPKKITKTQEPPTTITDEDLFRAITAKETPIEEIPVVTEKRFPYITKENKKVEIIGKDITLPDNRKVYYFTSKGGLVGIANPKTGELISNGNNLQEAIANSQKKIKLTTPKVTQQITPEVSPTSITAVPTKITTAPVSRQVTPTTKTEVKEEFTAKNRVPEKTEIDMINKLKKVDEEIKKLNDNGKYKNAQGQTLEFTSAKSEKDFVTKNEKLVLDKKGNPIEQTFFIIRDNKNNILVKSKNKNFAFSELNKGYKESQIKDIPMYLKEQYKKGKTSEYFESKRQQGKLPSAVSNVITPSKPRETGTLPPGGDKELPTPRMQTEDEVYFRGKINTIFENAKKNKLLISKFLKEILPEYDKDGFPIPANIKENKKFLNELERIEKNSKDLIDNFKEFVSKLKTTVGDMTALTQVERKKITDLIDELQEIKAVKKDLELKKKEFENKAYAKQKDIEEGRITTEELKDIQKQERAILLGQRYEDFDINANKKQLDKDRFRIIVDNEEKVVPGILYKDFVITKSGADYLAYDFKSGTLLQSSSTIPSLKIILDDTLKYNSKQIKATISERLKLFLEQNKDKLKSEGEKLNSEINEQFKNLNSRIIPFTPKEIVLMSKYGSWLLKNGINEVSLWTLKMSEKFGDSITPYIKSIYKHSKALSTDKIDEKKLEKLLENEQSMLDDIQKIQEKEISGVRQYTVSEKLINNFEDRLYPTKAFEGEVYQKNEDAVRGLGIAKRSIENNQLDLEGNIIGKSLNSILKMAGKTQKELEDFAKYIVYRAAIPRLMNGDKVAYQGKLLNIYDVDKELKILKEKNPQFINAGKEWNNFFKNVRELYKKENIYTDDYIEYLESTYPDYSPLIRDFSEKTRFTLFQKIKKGGSERDVVDPFISTVEQQARLYPFLLKNRANQEMLKIIRKNESFYKENGIEIGSVTKIKKGEEYLENIEDLEKENYITVLENGEKIKLIVKDKELYDALRGFSKTETSLAFRISEEISKRIKFASTGALAPVWLTKSITMDLTKALINSDNPLLHLSYVLQAIFSPISPKGFKNKIFSEMFANTGNGFSAALRDVKEQKIRVLKNTPLEKLKQIAISLNPVGKESFLQTLSDYAQNLNAEAAFRLKIEQLGGKQTPRNVRIASEYAKNATVNLARKGKLSKTIEAGVPYTNAAVQSVMQLLRNIRKNPLKYGGLLAVTAIVPKIIEYNNFKDDEDYQKLDPAIKYRSLIVGKRKDGTFIKITTDQQISFLGQLAIELIETIQRANPGMTKDALTAFMDLNLPSLASGFLKGFGGNKFFDVSKSAESIVRGTVASPVVSLLTNTSFSGSPIEPNEFKYTNISPSLRYTEKTSSAAKFLGKITNWSPAKIDYAARSFGGDLARFGIPATSEMASFNSQDLLRNFLADPVTTNTFQKDYYAMRNNLELAWNDAKEKNVELPKWFNYDVYTIVVKSKGKDSVSNKLSDLNEIKRTISIDKTIDEKTKKQMIRETQAKINKIYLDYNTVMRTIGVPTYKFKN